MQTLFAEGILALFTYKHEKDVPPFKSFEFIFFEIIASAA